MDMNVWLKKKLIELKYEKGISFTHWCKTLGINNSTITHFIKGNRGLSEVVQKKLYNELIKY